jgi:hypothetical protein
MTMTNYSIKAYLVAVLLSGVTQVEAGDQQKMG